MSVEVAYVPCVQFQRFDRVSWCTQRKRMFFRLCECDGVSQNRTTFTSCQIPGMLQENRPDLADLGRFLGSLVLTTNRCSLLEFSVVPLAPLSLSGPAPLMHFTDSQVSQDWLLASTINHMAKTRASRRLSI